MLGSHSNLLESLINLSVSVIILLFSVKAKLSSPYNRVLRVKGAMCPIAPYISLHVLFLSLSVSNIDYDLELQFLKSEEELEQERRAKAEQEERERRAREAKNAPPPQTPPTIGDKAPPLDSKAPPPAVDRSRKPNSMNNTSNNKNILDTDSMSRSKVRIETIHNNLNKPENTMTTNLDDLRKHLEQEKDTNRSEKASYKLVPDRALKPKSTPSGDTNTTPTALAKVENIEKASESSESSAKLTALEAHIAEKEQEAEVKQKENQRLALEHKVKFMS